MILTALKVSRDKSKNLPAVSFGGLYDITMIIARPIALCPGKSYQLASYAAEAILLN